MNDTQKNGSGSELAQRVQIAQAQQTGGVPITTSLGTWFKERLPHLTSLAGTEAEARKVYASALAALAKNPKLLSCSPRSLQGCIVQSAALKLYAGPLQECAFVPYLNRKTGEYEAQFIAQYGGLIKLALQSRIVSDMRAGVVYSNDFFEFEEGTNPVLRHRRTFGDRGERICVYAVAQLPGSTQSLFIVMGIAEVEAIRLKSPGRDSGPWAESEDTYNEMAKKTAIKRLCKLLPKSTELAAAIEADNDTERPDLAKRSVLDISSQLSEVQGERSPDPATPPV